MLMHGAVVGAFLLLSSCSVVRTPQVTVQSHSGWKLVVIPGVGSDSLLLAFFFLVFFFFLMGGGN